jgi:hypothetical protein
MSEAPGSLFRGWIPSVGSGRRSRLKRIAVLLIVTAVPWIPGAITFSMLVSGQA